MRLRLIDLPANTEIFLTKNDCYGKIIETTKENVNLLEFYSAGTLKEPIYQSKNYQVIPITDDMYIDALFIQDAEICTEEPKYEQLTFYD